MSCPLQPLAADTHMGLPAGADLPDIDVDTGFYQRDMSVAGGVFALSILNVLLRPDQLLVALDTWAEDAQTGEKSSGAKLVARRWSCLSWATTAGQGKQLLARGSTPIQSHPGRMAEQDHRPPSRRGKRAGGHLAERPSGLTPSGLNLVRRRSRTHHGWGAATLISKRRVVPVALPHTLQLTASMPPERASHCRISSSAVRRDSVAQQEQEAAISMPEARSGEWPAPFEAGAQRCCDDSGTTSDSTLGAQDIGRLS